LCGNKVREEKRYCDTDKCIGHVDKNTQTLDRIYTPENDSQFIVQVDKWQNLKSQIRSQFRR
jgi:hypothetical protein